MGQNCDICSKPVQIIFEVEKGIAPNRYVADSDSTIFRSQTVTFCEDCQLIENHHSFSMAELFGEYAYRSPDTTLDDAIAEHLANFIRTRNLNNIVEVAGNNGVFAEKVLSRLARTQDISYTIIDDVPLSCHNKNVRNIQAFLSSENRALFQGLAPDLVICRHAIAHNPSLKGFFADIVQILSPDYFYIENVSLDQTLKFNDFSQFYSEHFFHLTPFCVNKVAQQYGYNAIDIKQFEIHNGSFGILLGRVNEGVEFEFPLIACSKLRDELVIWAELSRRFWSELNMDDQDIVVWGCSAKFLFAYSALGLKEIGAVKMIVDSTPTKVGQVPPGMDVQVASEEAITELPKNPVFVVGARNFSGLIIDKIRNVLSCLLKYLFPLFRVFGVFRG